MIETVGVGQDEVDIVRLADVTVVILVPGMGDDVQTIKAGIMEIADVFASSTRATAKAPITWSARFARCNRSPRATTAGLRRSSRQSPAMGSGNRGTGGCNRGLRAHTCKKENLALNKSVENWQERLIEMLRDAMLEKARAQFAGERQIWPGWRRRWRNTSAIRTALVEEIAGKVGKR
jgi:LAO/AO transport system kinase